MNTQSRTARALTGGAMLGVNFLAIAAAVTSQETVTIGGSIFEVDTEGAGAFLTSGNTAVDLSGGTTEASQGTLTIAEPVTAEDTMTIGATTYTFKTGATAAAGEIGLGGDEAATKLAIVAAINGTDGVNTANASVSAAAFSGDDCVLTALEPGTVGDAVVSTETFTHVSNVFDAATLGTTNAGVDPTAAEAITAFAAAFLADPRLDAYAAGTDGIYVIDRGNTGGPIECTETLAGTDNAWENAVMIGKVDPADGCPISVIGSRAVNAAEAASGYFVLAFQGTPTSHLIQVRDSNGDVKAWDGAATVNGNAILLDASGDTDLAENDIVTIVAGL